MTLNAICPFARYYGDIFLANKPLKAFPFQIIGFDIMLDKKLNAYLLEIN